MSEYDERLCLQLTQKFKKMCAHKKIKWQNANW